jgi:NADH-quinone oxidoreductase subunit L
MHVIFQLSPVTQMIVAIIGAATLVIAGLSAVAQYDIKRVLAYSTISQIGYMFLALGVGAWSAAVFHFMIHAFFKALLFLAAGAIIEALHHEHNMFKMGGLRKTMPVIFWTFLIGSASLSALPLITAGFYSKDQILWFSWASDGGSPMLYGAALFGAFITAVYTSRMMIITFWGEGKTKVGHPPGKLMLIPLVILAVFSLLAGFIELPHNFGHVRLFSSLVEKVLPDTTLRTGVSGEFVFQLIAVLVTFAGIYSSYIIYYKKPVLITSLKTSKAAVNLYRFFLSGWRFDKLYDFVFVRPIVYLSDLNKNDIIDKLYQGITLLTAQLYRGLSFTQSGSLRWYVMGLLIGAIFILTLQIML